MNAMAKRQAATSTLTTVWTVDFMSKPSVRRRPRTIKVYGFPAHRTVFPPFMEASADSVLLPTGGWLRARRLRATRSATIAPERSDALCGPKLAHVKCALALEWHN